MSEAEQVARALRGRKSGSGWICFCPAHDNTKTPALSVSDSPEGKLLVKCHAGCDGSAVMNELQHRGIIDGKGHKAQALSEYEIAKQNTQKRQYEEKRRRFAQGLFTEGYSCEGTPAQRYLEEARGIKGLRFNRMINTLRFHPDVLHGPSGMRLPAILAQVRSPKGWPMGIHRTYLKSDGLGKADVSPTKMMLGPTSSGAVRFGPDAKVIALAEGIETALSIAMASRLTVWATLSTSGMKGLILPPMPMAEVVVIAADHDDAGLTAAEETAARLEAEGRAVSVIAPQLKGADFNDVLRGETS